MTRSRKKLKNEQPVKALMREFRPKTVNQASYIRTVIESDVTVCYGPSGTGKTMCATGLACEHLIQGKVNQILLSRSIIGCDNDIGALPGDVNDKTKIYMLPYSEYFQYFLGSKYEENLHWGNIKFMPVELLRGHTYNESIMILEEAQNCTPKQIKLFLTRLGRNSKAIVIGDNKQSDVPPHENGLQFLITHMQDIPKFSFAKLDNTDILRHPILGEVINRFESHGV